MREALSHVDATLRLFDDEIDPGSIAPKKPYKRVKLFGEGELNRLISDAMRKRGEPMRCPDIAASIVETLGHDQDAAKGMVRRVRANLQYLAKVAALCGSTGSGSTRSGP